MADRYTLAEAGELFAARLRREAESFDLSLLTGPAPESVREGRCEAWQTAAEWRADGFGQVRGWRDAAWLVQHMAAHPEVIDNDQPGWEPRLEPEPENYRCACGTWLPCRHCDGGAGQL